MNYPMVQSIAKETMEYIKQNIKSGQNLTDIRKMCEDKMLKLGAESFWYWDIGAFVFSGNETTLSISGKEYVTSDRIINDNDILTIDLSPQIHHIWGDYARTIIIENGMVVKNINTISNQEWKRGLLMEEALHSKLIEIITPDTTFEQLYYQINDYIKVSGYINLDFMGNLGHSIVKQKDDRIYVEKGNTSKISDVAMFTFEPHISVAGSKYGYKKENIYAIKDKTLIEI